ncbi:MAG: hypothetical protein QM772_07055 [Ottowia sp.]|uniref:hypothetical protein n=1 Tax=Ottowia sp. TaxID=1898956 RepID=UPI0039E5CD91
MKSSFSRLPFATRYALRHLGICLVVVLLTAALVFGLLYPPPYRAMLGVGPIFLLVLAVDVVCGPLLTLVVASPRKSRRERWLDLGLIGLIQALALAYGLHSVWVARPAVLAFEVDRLVVATANEVDVADLPNAPPGLRRLPWWGVLQVGTRRAADGAELMDSVQRGLAGWSPAAQPGWWLPWDDARADLKARAKPLPELMARRPRDAEALRGAAAGTAPDRLFYLPLTSSSTKDWVALLDADGRLVGHAAVDGF